MVGVSASLTGFGSRWTVIAVCAIASACSLASPDGVDVGEEAASAGCKVGETLCTTTARACVDLSTSSAHCGACGAACARGHACVAGKCREDRCAEGLRACGTACVDTDADNAHCGGCGQTCIGSCGGGRCASKLTPTAPVVASNGAASCEVRDTSTGRKVAVDDGGVLYALMTCGTKLAVAASGDGAKSFGAPIALELTPGVTAILGGPPGTAWIAAAAPSGVSVSSTTDGGASWSPPRNIGAAGADNWLGIARRDGVLIVGTRVGATARILRSASADASAFEETTVSTTMEYGDVLVDPRDGAVWLVGDAPGLRTHRSADGGKTFGAETSTGANVYYSDWALGGGTLFALGTGSTLARLDVGAPQTNTPLTGMRVAADRRRALSAWADGTLFVGTETPATSGATLMRVPAGATTAPTRATLSPVGQSPAVLALSDRLVFVTYAVGGQVLATIQEP